MNPFLNPSAYDFITLAGEKSPGLAKVSGGVRARNWDERKATGVSGASLVYQGESLVKFKVTFILIKSSEFISWQTFAKILQKEPTFKSPKALQFYHPFITDQLGVKSVVVENLGQIEETGDNEISISVDFREYRAPRPVAAPTKGTVPSAGDEKPPPPDANSDLRASINKDAETLFGGGANSIIPIGPPTTP